MLGETVGRARVSVASPRKVTTKRSTAALLEELGGIVSAHAQGDYASLEREPRFWALVSHLHARHRDTRRQGARDAPGAGQRAVPEPVAAEAPVDAEEPVDAEVSAPDGVEAVASEEAGGTEEVPDVSEGEPAAQDQEETAGTEELPDVSEGEPAAEDGDAPINPEDEG